MNKRVIFHVGPPKTGSSAIQQFLHQHRQQLLASGVLYPAHSVDENGISSGNAREICVPDPEGRLALDHQKLTNVLNAFENNPKAHILLLSSESFFRIIDDITQAVPDVEIICFLRNPVEFQLSIYNQSVKRHGNQKPFTPGKRLNLGQWESILKAANQLEAHQLHCFAYKNHGEKGNVITDVLGVLGLRDELSVSGNSVNVSYSFAALELKRWLNQFPIDALQAELDAYLQAASAGAGRYRLLDDETLAAYKQQLANVTAKFQRLLPEQDWQLVTEALNNVAALPYYQQGVHESEIAGLVCQLRRDKPMLFRSLSVIVDSAEQPDYDASLKSLFELSRGARWFAALPLFFKRKLGEVRQKRHVSAHKSTLQPPASLNNAVKVTNADIIPQLSGSTPARLRGGVRAKELPEFAHQFRYQQINLQQSAAVCATETEVLAEQPEVTHLKKGHYYYGGPAFGNFVHFIAESIHRLAALSGAKQQANISKVLILPQLRRRLRKLTKPLLPPNFYEILAYLGVDKSQVVLVDKPQRVENLWIAPQQSLFRTRSQISADYRQFLLQCERRAGVLPDKHLPAKLYVSRTPFLMRGSFAGERYVEQFFARQGYTIFRPEKHSLYEQFRYYKSAAEIVLAEGAALHVMELLGEMNARITVLQRRSNSDQLFSPILEARCKNVNFFGALKVLPSLFVVKGYKSAAHGSALSVLHASAFKGHLTQQLALNGFDTDEFLATVRQDIDSYFNAYVETLRSNDDLKQIPDEFIEKVKELEPPYTGGIAENWPAD
ncbi:hypothetical protein C6Y40_02220 [Alteromonas alba]|uniref:Glycosyltransferase 61 catalytic domain-containing protein n=1 Tax=Alteromonas alba TaxID=2079529 RepID=A0A2S9VG81_9ALTE|nr:glycosyltransferase 61 family protein [Alteromonas alba]PRO75325.1 hypothetical protein C6Y40_02220 [Alteromonas alba]